MEPGTTIGAYKVTGALGAGGMGEVWRAEDTNLGREVALKMLPEDFAADEERHHRFEREARMLAALNHQNIATLFGLEHLDGQHVLVMELVEGEGLDQLIDRGPLAAEHAVPIAIQIAEALEAAHEAGIVHRDLKPANVRIRPDGMVKVLDFGLAKVRESEPASSHLSHSPTITRQHTLAGVILGTAAYMSPEQARGKPVDKRSDIWAFGVVLWEMLTGTMLFTGDTVPDILAAVLTGEFRLDAVPSSTPPRLRELLARCLERDPRRRLRDIGEARIILEDSQDGTTDSRVPARRPRPSWLPIVAAGVLSALATVAAFQTLTSAPAPAPLRKLDLLAEGFDVEWFTAPTLSPDGSQVAYNAEGGIWVREFDNLSPRRVASSSETAPIFWSPDGNFVGYSDGKKLWRVPSRGGAAVVICDLPGTGKTIGGAWRPDGKIAFASWRGGLFSVPAEGGRPTPMFPHDPEREIDFHFPSWLPDGRLLFVAHLNLSEPSLSGNGSSLQSAGSLAVMEAGVFDGQARHTIDWGTVADIEWLTFDPQTQLLLFTRTDPSEGIWARPFDPVALKLTGDEFLLIPDAKTLSLASDDSLLYMESRSKQGVTELVWTDRSGRVQAVVAPAQPGLAEPALSPDGLRVAVTAKVGPRRDLWIVDIERASSSRLTFEDSDASGPVWDSRSGRLVYSELRGMTSKIVTRAADGSDERRELIRNAGYGLWGGLAVFSPDGRRMIFAVDERGPTHLRLAELTDDGTLGEPRPFFSSRPEPSVRDARISPDGQFLAYMSTDSGQPEVYLTRFPEGEGRWQVSADGGRQPRWAATSGELFFVAGSGPVLRVMTSVLVSVGPPVAVGSPTKLFTLGGSSLISASYEGFDVTTDGRRFLMVRASAAGGFHPWRMILVQNWINVLQRRAPQSGR